MEAHHAGRVNAPLSPALLGDLVWCFHDEPVDRARQLMVENDINRLPILDRDMHLCGVLTARDLLTYHRENATTGQILKDAGKIAPANA